jgi:ribosomal protein L27
MVAINFMDRFVIPIELGTKQQTIRKHRNGREIRVGDTLHLQRGDRFHPVRIGTATVVDSLPILLLLDEGQVAFDRPGRRRLVSPRDLDRFAVRDGFTDWNDLRAFWRATHGPLPHFLGMLHSWGTTFKGPLDHPPR